MPEIAGVRCEVCGAEWDPRERLLGAQGCPNALDHPVVHDLRARLAEAEKKRCECGPDEACQYIRERNALAERVEAAEAEVVKFMNVANQNAVEREEMVGQARDAALKAEAERDAERKSAQGWRDRYSEQCSLYHDAVAEREAALVQAAGWDDKARTRVLEADCQVTKLQLELKAAHEEEAALNDALANTTKRLTEAEKSVQVLQAAHANTLANSIQTGQRWQAALTLVTEWIEALDNLRAFLFDKSIPRDNKKMNALHDAVDKTEDAARKAVNKPRRSR